MAEAAPFLRLLVLAWPVLVVPASEFHGVPFGPVPAGFFGTVCGSLWCGFFGVAGGPNGIRDSQGHVKNEKASFMMIRGCFVGVCLSRKPNCHRFVHRPLQISEILVHFKINS